MEIIFLFSRLMFQTREERTLEYLFCRLRLSLMSLRWWNSSQEDSLTKDYHGIESLTWPQSCNESWFSDTTSSFWYCTLDDIRVVSRHWIRLNLLRQWLIAGNTRRQDPPAGRVLCQAFVWSSFLFTILFTILLVSLPSSFSAPPSTASWCSSPRTTSSHEDALFMRSRTVWRQKSVRNDLKTGHDRRNKDVESKTSRPVIWEQLSLWASLESNRLVGDSAHDLRSSWKRGAWGV